MALAHHFEFPFGMAHCLVAHHNPIGLTAVHRAGDKLHGEHEDGNANTDPQQRMYYAFFLFDHLRTRL